MIAILDWGIGGIGLLSTLRQRNRQMPLLYFSDSGFLPYGKVSAPVLRNRVRAVAGFLVRQGATHLAVACNAASTALPSLGVRGIAGQIETEAGPIQTTGVIAHGIRQVRKSGRRRVGVIGGRRTIRSGIYRKALVAPRRRVESRIAQPLSAHVEKGDLRSARVQADIEKILTPLEGIDALLMACTHYPALQPLFEAALPGVQMLDPIPDMASWVLEHFQTPPTNNRSAFYTTGDPANMIRSAALAFGHKVQRVQRIPLDLTDP